VTTTAGIGLSPRDASLAVGVVAGLAAALFSALSYFVSRDYSSRGGTSPRLLVLGHAVMGAVCLPVARWLWPQGVTGDPRWLLPLAGSTFCYLLGQGLVFAALRRADASRVAPLLGLKIAMLAGITAARPGGGLDASQWTAVGMSVAAATMLQRGGGVSAAALTLTLAACLTFAVSDLFIVGLIDGLERSADLAAAPIDRLSAGSLAMAVTYVVCGCLAVVALLAPAARPRSRLDWTAAVTYAAMWLAGMVGLYVCFGIVGAVFGNILQSTRGMIAIVIGAALAHLGRHDLETRIDRTTFLRRLVAAALMTAAIALSVIDLS